MTAKSCNTFKTPANQILPPPTPPKPLPFSCQWHCQSWLPTKKTGATFFLLPLNFHVLWPIAAILSLQVRQTTNELFLHFHGHSETPYLSTMLS